MRALVLSALAFAATASAQALRILPDAPRSEPPTALVPRDCGRGADMRIPLSPDVEPVPMPAIELDGPEPVSMPNLCAEDVDLTAEADADRFQSLLRRLPAPNPLRRRRELRTNPHLREQLRQFRGLDEPGDLLALPPVAPPDDRP